jgi:hypothetical protein
MSNFSVPPVPPAFEPFRPEPGWIKVVGIISIVIGSLGLLCNCGGLVMTPMSSKVYEVIPQLAGKTPPVEALPGPMNYLTLVLAVGCSAVLLTAGILLLKRNTLSRTLHLVYAGVTIPLTIVSILIALPQQAALQEWIQANSGMPPNPAQNIGQYVGMGCSGIIGMAYPVFLLVWFLAMGKKIPPRTDFPAA